jgi:hypothetical protein
MRYVKISCTPVLTNAQGYQQYALAMLVTPWNGHDPWAFQYQVAEEDRGVINQECSIT